MSKSNSAMVCHCCEDIHVFIKEIMNVRNNTINSDHRSWLYGHTSSSSSTLRWLAMKRWDQNQSYLFVTLIIYAGFLLGSQIYLFGWLDVHACRAVN